MPRTQTLPSFCALLIEQQLDRLGTLGGPSAAGTPSSFLSIGSIDTSINNRTVVSERTGFLNGVSDEAQAPAKAKRKRKPPIKGGPEFEAFWAQYLALKHRANGQTKPAALVAWTKVTKDITPEQLQRALGVAATEQNRAQRENGWAAPFPDCQRWLSKGYWQQYMDRRDAVGLVAGNAPDLTPPPEHADCPF